MKNIALVGPFHQTICAAFKNALPTDFELITVSDEKDYSAISQADYIVNRTFKLNAEHLREAKNLRLVQKWGAGYDNIDAAGIATLDIPVAICAGINAQPVAELTVLHMLAVLRNICALDKHLKNGKWPRDEYIPKSYLLGGKTVGLVGLGNIGKKVATLVKAFGSTVVYYDAYRMTVDEENSIGVKYMALDELLNASDIVSLHLPLNKDTENFFNSDKLSKMKCGSILINTSRGGIVNERDLAIAIEQNHIMGAGLDAMSFEPPAEDCPLLKLERVILTPHVGGNTADNEMKMVERCVDNIQRIEQKRPLRRKELVNQNGLRTHLETEE